MSKPRRYTGPDDATRDLVVARACGVCEICGDGVIAELHHRKPRRMGGTADPAINLPSNLLAVCRTCHDGIEFNRHYAYGQGWICSADETPSEIAVILTVRHGGVRRKREFYLADDGTRSTAA